MQQHVCFDILQNKSQLIFKWENLLEKGNTSVLCVFYLAHPIEQSYLLWSRLFVAIQELRMPHIHGQLFTTMSLSSQDMTKTALMPHLSTIIWLYHAGDDLIMAVNFLKESTKLSVINCLWNCVTSKLSVIIAKLLDMYRMCLLF
jgi:hypothetical protein